MTLVLADIDVTGVELLADHLSGLTDVRAAELDVATPTLCRRSWTTR